MIDGSVVGLHVGSDHKPVLLEVTPHPTHRALTPAVSLQVGAVPGKGQSLSQHQSEGFEEQGVSGREQIGFLSAFERRPAQQSQTIAPLQQLPAEADNLSLPVSAEVPHVGMVRVVAPSFAQPGVSGFPNTFIEEIVEGDVHSSGILTAHPDRS